MAGKPTLEGHVSHPEQTAGRAYTLAFDLLDHLHTVASEAATCKPAKGQHPWWEKLADSYAGAFWCCLELQHSLSDTIRERARECHAVDSALPRFGDAPPRASVIEALASGAGSVLYDALFTDGNHPFQLANGQSWQALLGSLGAEPDYTVRKTIESEWNKQNATSAKAALSAIRFTGIDFHEWSARLHREGSRVTRKELDEREPESAPAEPLADAEAIDHLVDLRAAIAAINPDMKADALINSLQSPQSTVARIVGALSPPLVEDWQPSTGPNDDLIAWQRLLDTLAPTRPYLPRPFQIATRTVRDGSRDVHSTEAERAREWIKCSLDYIDELIKRLRARITKTTDASGDQLRSSLEFLAHKSASLRVWELIADMREAMPEGWADTGQLLATLDEARAAKACPGYASDGKVSANQMQRFTSQWVQHARESLGTAEDAIRKAGARLLGPPHNEETAIALRAFRRALNVLTCSLTSGEWDVRGAIASLTSLSARLREAADRAAVRASVIGQTSSTSLAPASISFVTVEASPVSTSKLPAKKKRKRWSPTPERPLTPIEINTLRVVGDHSGNILAAAKTLDRDPKTVRENYQRALRKTSRIGGHGSRSVATQRLPQDRRGQTNVADDD